MPIKAVSGIVRTCENSLKENSESRNPIKMV